MTLPDHDQCRTHRSYKLGCEQYEQVLRRSGQRCEICGCPGVKCVRRKLAIDHYGPRWAVRGLLCHTCNTALTSRAAKTAPWAVGYVANSWWVGECERLGISTAFAPEPDYGSAIFDQFNTLWLREGDGLWRPNGRGKPGISSATWRWLYDQRGPQNMALVDLYDRDAPFSRYCWPAEKAMLQGLIAVAGITLNPPHDWHVLDRLPVLDSWAA